MSVALSEGGRESVSEERRQREKKGPVQPQAEREREAQRGRVGRPSSTPGSLSVAAAVPAVLGVQAAVVLVAVPVRVVDVEWGRAIVVPASVPPARPSGADPACLGCVYV